MEEWIKELPCAVTVCDISGAIVYMNALSCATFCPDGRSLIGTNLKQYHSPSSWAKIVLMLDGELQSNHYTIQKGDIHKIIHQMPWRRGGVICGLVEISTVIPLSMEHHIRH